MEYVILVFTKPQYSTLRLKPSADEHSSYPIQFKPLRREYPF
jgi:hypothetical protein